MNNVLSRVSHYCISFILIMAPMSQLHSVEPASTAAAAVTVAKLFSPKQGRPDMAILKANNQLIKSLHARLDNVENGILNIIDQLNIMDSRIYEQNRLALSEQVGLNIMAIGSSYYEFSTNFEHIKHKYGKGSKQYINAVKDMRNILRDSILEFNIKRNTLLTDNRLMATNVLTVMAAASIEFSMLVDYEKQFDGLPGLYMSTAKAYLDYLNRALDVNDPHSLSTLIKSVEEDIRTDRKLTSWKKLSGNIKAEFTSADVIGDYQTFCVNEQHPVYYDASGPYECNCIITGIADTKGRWCDICYRNPAHTGYPYALTRYHKLIFSTSERLGGYDILKVDSQFSTLTNHDAYCGTHKGTSFPYDQIKSPDIEHANLIVKRSNLLSTLQHLRDEVSNIIPIIKQVSEGDKSKIQQVIATNVGIPDLQAISRESRDISIIARSRTTAEYKQALIEKRKQVSDLILTLDTDIQHEFEKAAKASKYLETLNAVSGAIQLYNFLENYYLSESKGPMDEGSFINEVNHTKNQLEKEFSREPASVGKVVLNNLDGILDNISWFGGLLNASRQMNILNSEVAKAAANIPKGTSVKYGIYTTGSNLYYIAPATEDVMGPDNMKLNGYITIQGKK